MKLAAARHGQPGQVRHDLSQRLAQACVAALPQAAHFVCHSHLASDVGQDLYQAPQAALTQRGLGEQSGQAVAADAFGQFGVGKGAGILERVGQGGIGTGVGGSAAAVG